MTALPEKGKLRQMVEMFENERYIPLSGWGKALLPADPQSFTSREGTVGAKTSAEYDTFLLTAGWVFEEEEDWVTAKADVNTDEDGWSYSLDFGGFLSSKSDLAGGELQERSSVVLFDDSSCSIDSSENMPIDLAQMEQINRANAKMGVTPPATPTRTRASTIGAASPEHVYESKGSQEKGLTTVVRRRRLTRWMEFHPLMLLSDEYSKATALSSDSVPPPKLTCNHCDYQELDKLAGALLKALTEASLVAHPRYFDEVKINKLKSGMMSGLELKQQHSDMVDFSLLSDSQRAAQEQEQDKEQGYSFQSTVSRLDAFITSCKSGWATISGSISSDSATSLQEKQAKRESIVATYYYSYPERRAVAEMIIRGSDRRHQFHCEAMDCGSGCHFAPQACPHEGCGLVFSMVHLPSHDEACTYKAVPCTRGCTEMVAKPVKPPKRGDKNKEEEEEGAGGGEGEEQKKFEQVEQVCLVPRREMDKHLEHACPLRPVDCPYGVLGCMAPGLIAVNLVTHLEECSISHSLLLVEQVKRDRDTLGRLEAENSELRKTVAFLVEADSRTEAKIDTAIAGITTATTAKFVAVQKASKEAEKLFFAGVERKFGEKDEVRRRELAAEKERTNAEFRKVAEALRAQKTYTTAEFGKIAQAAQERRNPKK